MVDIFKDWLKRETILKKRKYLEQNENTTFQNTWEGTKEIL